MDIENGNLKIIFQKISYTNINENKPDKDKKHNYYKVNKHGVCLALEVDVAQQREYLHVLGVELAVGCREAEAPLAAGDKQVVEQSAVVASEIALLDGERHGVVAHDDHLVCLGMIGGLGFAHYARLGLGVLRVGRGTGRHEECECENQPEYHM